MNWVYIALLKALHHDSFTLVVLNSLCSHSCRGADWLKHGCHLHQTAPLTTSERFVTFIRDNVDKAFCPRTQHKRLGWSRTRTANPSVVSWPAELQLPKSVLCPDILFLCLFLFLKLGFQSDQVIGIHHQSRNNSGLLATTTVWMTATWTSRVLGCDSRERYQKRAYKPKLK